MSRRLILAAVAGLTATLAAAQADDPLAVAFASSCLPAAPALQTYDDLTADLRAAGWTPLQTYADPELAAYVAADLQPPLPPEITVRFEVFSATLAGAPLHAFALLILNPGDAPFVTCAVMDLAATAADEAPVVALLGEPTGTDLAITDPGWVRHWISPAGRPGIFSIEMTFAPDGSVTAENAHFSGVSVTAHWFAGG